MSWLTPPRVKTRQRTAAHSGARPAPRGRIRIVDNKISFCIRTSPLNETSLAFENHANDSRIKYVGDVSPILTSRAGTGGGNLPIVLTQCGTDVALTLTASDFSPTATQGRNVVCCLWWDGNDTAGTLTCSSSNQYMPDKGRLQCVVGISRAALNMGENAKFGLGIEEDVQPTLTSRGPGAVCGKEQDLKSVRMRGGCEGGGKGALVGNNLSHTLATGNDQVIIGSECLDMRQVEAQDNNIAPTLIATNYKGGKCIVEHSVAPTIDASIYEKNGFQDASKYLIEQSCYPINSMVIGKELQDTDRQTLGIGNEDDASPTILAEQHHAVAIASNIIDRDPKNGGNGVGAKDELAYTLDTSGGQGVAVDNPISVSAMGFVRKLLPIECERLMGFPDNWTQIPWLGKPAEQCPDAPRYKACGNSMCVNVMRWIGEQIDRVDRMTVAEDEE